MFAMRSQPGVRSTVFAGQDVPAAAVCDASGACTQVARQLQSQNIDPRTAGSLKPDDLKKAFAAAKVRYPLTNEHSHTTNRHLAPQTASKTQCRLERCL